MIELLNLVIKKAEADAAERKFDALIPDGALLCLHDSVIKSRNMSVRASYYQSKKCSAAYLPDSKNAIALRLEIKHQVLIIKTLQEVTSEYIAALTDLAKALDALLICNDEVQAIPADTTKENTYFESLKNES